MSMLFWWEEMHMRFEVLMAVSWKILCSGMWHCERWNSGTSISEEYTTIIFSIEIISFTMVVAIICCDLPDNTALHLRRQ